MELGPFADRVVRRHSKEVGRLFGTGSWVRLWDSGQQISTKEKEGVQEFTTGIAAHMSHRRIGVWLKAMSPFTPEILFSGIGANAAMNRLC